jgi:hypothetical protein
MFRSLSTFRAMFDDYIVSHNPSTSRSLDKAFKNAPRVLQECERVKTLGEQSFCRGTRLTK